MLKHRERRVQFLLIRLQEFRKAGADHVSFSALLGDDDVWTIGQEIGELHALLVEKAGGTARSTYPY